MILQRFWIKHTQLCRTLSIILDATLLVSFSCLLYVLLAGELRWRTALFQVTLANFSGPLKVLGLTTIIRAVLGLNMGICSSITHKLWPYLSTIPSLLNRFELIIIQFFIKEKLNIACSIMVLILSLTFLEFYMRYFPHTLPYALGNHIASGYQTGIYGIYREKPEMKMHLMRPNYKRMMYFNGYYWHHETDAMGFRNPVDRSSANVVLLGDSMIYGHGVEETSTVRHYLENILQKPVANLGIQGSSIHEEYQVLKTFGVNLHPRFVFLFFLVNDIRGLAETLDDKEMIRFISLPVDDHKSPYFEIPETTYESYGLSAYLREFYVVKSFDFMVKYIHTYLFRNANAFENSWHELAFFEANPRFLLAMKFHLYALRKIQNIAKINNFNFVNVFIHTGVSYPDPESIYENILEDYCNTYAIPFYNLKDELILAAAQGKEVVLKRDGHFSDAGARVVASALAKLIQN